MKPKGDGKERIFSPCVSKRKGKGRKYCNIAWAQGAWLALLNREIRRAYREAVECQKGVIVEQENNSIESK